MFHPRNAESFTLDEVSGVFSIRFFIHSFCSHAKLKGRSSHANVGTSGVSPPDIWRLHTVYTSFTTEVLGCPLYDNVGTSGVLTVPPYDGTEGVSLLWIFLPPR